MARKQFVSSKKNAPSRAISSKESALQERNHVSANEVARDSDSESDGSNSPTSVSSQDSSDGSSSEEDDHNGQQDHDPASGAANQVTTQPLAVEVMPSSFGRGKQLRFASMVSHDKESHESMAGGNGSDSEESYASIADSQSSGDEDDANDHRVQDSGYPIKGHRARKRHHPNSEYVQKMSTYVRDCLLSVRLNTEEQERINKDANAHKEFRAQLRNGSVERITWKPEEANPKGDGGDQEKSRKRQKTKTKSKDHDKSKTSSSSSSKSKKKESSERDRKPKEPASTSTTSSSSSTSTSGTTTTTKDEKTTNVNTTAAAFEPKKPKENAKDSQKPPRASKTSNAAANKESCNLCANCRKAINKSDPELPKPIPLESPAPTTHRPGKFTIDSAPRIKDIAKLRVEATKLNEEARTLKHEGNRKGGVEAGIDGQVTQAKFYLRSSGKFFQHALMLNDIKMLYKELGDVSHARQYGEYCVTTLKQTTSLIESTTRTFQSAKNIRLVALSYKFSAIMHLSIFRLQHLKLFSLFSDLFTPNRSPDSRQAVTPTPPGNGSDLNSKEHAIRQLLLKESEHFLRGCEMWRRFESCKVVVLPRVADPLVADLSEAFFADMETELQV